MAPAVMTDPQSQGSGRVLAPVARDEVEPLTAPPTFSVVIPAYQAAETIGEALRSVLGQSHPAHEVFVVDDGSTDDLAGAVRPFEGEVEVISKSNGGAASARNAGAEAAAGDFMAVLDADDCFHPRRIEVLVELASQRPDLDLVTTDARFVIAGEAVGSFLAENPFETEDQRTAILKSCFVGGWPAARVSRLREVGGFDESLPAGHDWDCWLRMILDGSRAGLVDRPYYDYVLHSGSVTSDRAGSFWDRVRLLQKAAANPSLKPAERPIVEQELRRRRTEAVQEETRGALAGSGSRRRLLRLAALPGVGLRARAFAALAVPAPALARRLSGARRLPEERLAGGE
jgi:Glycosyl transferase family 2